MINKKILYIDGFNMFYSSMAANTETTDVNGEPIGGAITFLRQLLFTMYKLSPHCVVIVFDGENAGSRRRTIIKDYKNRKARKTRTVVNELGEFSNEDQQFLLLLQVLDNLPVKLFTVDNVEADDVISYLVNKNKHHQQFICSSDKDFLQLVDANTFVWSPIKRVLFTPEKVQSTYSIPAYNFIWQKVVLGDTSDNVHKIPGIGKKTFTKILPLLNHQLVETPSDFINYIHSLEGKSKALEHLKAADDIIMRNYKLMKLDPMFCGIKAVEEIRDQNLQQQVLNYSWMKTQIYFTRNNLGTHFSSFTYFNQVWSKIILNLVLND